MFSQTKTKESMNHYWDSIRQATNLIQNANHILVGVGSGATAAGGLCYTDPALAEKWYPEYFGMGKKSIIDIMSDFWPTTLNDKNATAFWGFWAKHIYHIRYEAEALQPYIDLFQILKDKQHFICSTNVDGQLEKTGFSKEIIFAPQGEYALFQCSKPCTQEVYQNKPMIDTMLANMVSPFEIHTTDIPRCPNCGGYLIPNLRCDYAFVEKPHMQNANKYKVFLSEVSENNLVLLELGVGINTPGIIRYPFERIAAQYPKASLVRINISSTALPKEIEEKSVGIENDVGKILRDIVCFDKR